MEKTKSIGKDGTKINHGLNRQEKNKMNKELERFKVVTNEDIINQMYGQKDGTFGEPEIPALTESVEK